MKPTPFGVKFSRIMREIHAFTMPHYADSLAKSIGIAGARGNSMKKILLNIMVAMMLVSASLQIHAQGILIDQESATGPVGIAGNGNADGLNLQKDSPLMQSFIPSLSAIGFVSLELWDVPASGNQSATVYVNLYESGTDIDFDTLLGTSALVDLPSGYGNGVTQSVSTFDFTTAIALTPGDTYYIEPVVRSSDSQWDIITIANTYPDGQVFQFINPLNTDFWFQEGVLAVPEPTTLALIGFVGLLPLLFKHRLKLPVLGMRSSSIQYWQ